MKKQYPFSTFFVSCFHLSAQRFTFRSIIALDDLLYERMTHDIHCSQLREADAFDPLQKPAGIEQTAVFLPDQIDLGNTRV